MNNNRSSVKVTHIGIDYATVTLVISTDRGSETIQDIQVSRFIGEALDEAGMTAYEVA